MIRNVIRAAVPALVLLFAPGVFADYEAGRQAWDAGRPDEALAQWRAAADAGDRRAMLGLGRLYAQGLGAPQDYVEAHKWFNLAGSRGEVAAVGERDALAAKMTPQQVAAAQALARAWRPGGGGAAAFSRKYPAGTKLRDCDECPELVVVPSGSYMMGSPSSEDGRYDDEGPVHRVRIGRAFAVGVYEVTFGEWDACVSGGSCGRYRPSDEGWGRGRRPVINVSWDNAKAYVAWLSRKTGEEYRLLSESEWEYVARGGTETARYWGEGESGQCRNANGADREAKRHNSGWTTVECDDGHYRTSPVGRYEANGFGLRDVLGNVWEWVEDCWNESYRGAPTDGSAWVSGDCSQRVLRGGSWFDLPKDLRSAARLRDTSGNRHFNYLGFRVARTLTP